jgi:preprotein translocase subunit SecA
LVELKEKLRPSDEREVLARLTYQGFFQRYHWLAGITGTAREVRGEMRRVYGLRLLRIPTHKPCRRRMLGMRLFAGLEQQQGAILERVQQMSERGQPVLIGTRSLAASERLSETLCAHGIEHQLLNARQDQDEARVVAAAGKRGAITIATNMAGRGTDIALGEGVAELGGLHVIATEMNDAGRIDRQLFGRGARQGDPGSYEVIQTLSDDLARRYLPELLRRSLAASEPLNGIRAALVLRWVQLREEGLLRLDRKRMLKQERELTDKLAFTGSRE